MVKNKLKKVFPGGNTCKGFYSFYDYIIEANATRIYIIKGGPGVGKSTFMKKIGEAMLDRGFEVEFHCCSSDNNSLDGVVIPAIKVALIDGTTPHIVEPKNPGVVDEIIYLGDFWDETRIRMHKEEVLKTNFRIKRLYAIAYSALKEAKVIRDEWESYVSEAMIESQVNKAVAGFLQAIFCGIASRYDRPAKVRHLFATAITPDGIVTGHVESLLDSVQQLYTVCGEPGSGVPQVLARIADMAAGKGLHAEVYHCPFNPANIDLIILPEIKVAAMNVHPPHTYDPSFIPNLTARKLNLSAYIDQEKLAAYAHEISSATYRYQACLDRAVSYIRQAKLTHDYMEDFYVPAMNFEAINSKRQDILQRIINYATEFHEALNTSD